jgi:transcriptional regulator with XRE-family HTH domain
MTNEEIRAFRNKYRITLHEIAQGSAISFGKAWKIDNDIYTPTPEELERIVMFLKKFN